MPELNTIAAFQTDHYTYIGVVAESDNAAALMSDVLVSPGGTRTDHIPADPANSWSGSMHFRPDGLREPTSKELWNYMQAITDRTSDLAEQKKQTDQTMTRLAAIAEKVAEHRNYD